MTHHFHAVIWLDHHEARVFEFSPEDVQKLVIHPEKPSKHLHHKAGVIGAGHSKENDEYYHAVGEAVSHSGEVLILGPGSAKLALIKHLHKHDPNVAEKVVGVETVDHPSDAQVVAYARHYFAVKDKATPQRV